LLREVLTNIGETVRLLMTTDGGVMLHELIWSCVYWAEANEANAR
jgi:hypothetical protein